MSARFRLRCAWSRRAEALAFDPDDLVDAPPLFVGLERFVAHNEGHVDLHAGPIAMRFDLHADLALVFDELPDMLEELAATMRGLSSTSRNRAPILSWRCDGAAG
jgi:hypothetical protein